MKLTIVEDILIKVNDSTISYGGPLNLFFVETIPYDRWFGNQNKS